MEADTRRERAFVPIKAVRNNVSSSVFWDPVIWRLTKMIMRCGRMHLARKMVDDMMMEIKTIQMNKYRRAKTEEEKAEIELDPVALVKRSLENMSPVVITRPIKRGGATYQVPHPIGPHFSEFLAIKWVTDGVKERPRPQKESFEIVLAREFVAGYYNEGKTVRKKMEMHRVCEANKAYAHYRWG